MKRKVYSTPAIKVVSMKHRVGFLCFSGAKTKSVKSVNSPDIDYVGTVGENYYDN